MAYAIVFWMFLIPSKITYPDGLSTETYTPIYNDTHKRCTLMRKRFDSLPSCFKVTK